jgi:hypothetical protein
VAEPVELQVTAGIGSGVTTRTEDATLDKWIEGANMIVSAVSGTKVTTHSDATYKLIGSSTQYGTFTSDAGFVFDPTETDNVTFVAYTYNETTAPAITTGTDNKKIIKLTATADGKLPDLMYAKKTATATSPSVNFAFEHLLTQLTIIIKLGDDIAESNLSATLGNFNSDATFDVGTTKTPSATTAATSTATISTGTDGSTFNLVAGTQNLKVQVTNNDKTYTAYITNSLTAGTAYVCTITLKKTGLVIGSGSGSVDDDGNPIGSSSNDACTITLWKNADSELSGTASMATTK